MINRFLLLITVFLASNQIYAQTDFYFDFSGTYSFIPKTELINDAIFTYPVVIAPTLKITESYDVKPGFNLGFGFNKTIIDRFSISSGIGFAYYSFKKEVRMDLEDNNQVAFETKPGVPIGSYFGHVETGDIQFQDLDPELTDRVTIATPDYGMTRIVYLSIPVRFYYSIIPDRFRIGLGVTNYLVAYSSQITMVTDFQTHDFSQKEYNDESSNGLSNYQLNGDLSLEYRVFKGLWVRSSYSHGFFSIFDQPQQNTYYQQTGNKNAKYRTVELGLKYTLR